MQHSYIASRRIILNPLLWDDMYNKQLLYGHQSNLTGLGPTRSWFAYITA